MPQPVGDGAAGRVQRPSSDGGLCVTAPPGRKPGGEAYAARTEVDGCVSPIDGAPLGMKSQFRSTVPEDAAAISAFLQEVLEIAPENPTVALEHMRWKYWSHWADWPETRGYVMVQEGDLVAHGAVVPLTCRSEDRQIK